MTHTFQTILSVGLGGALGALLRIGMRPLVHTFFPLVPQMGTLIVNLIGCFCIGLFASIFDRFDNINHNYHLFLVWGVLGAFTTYSTYGLDAINLISSGQLKTFFIYILISNVLGISLVYIAYQLGSLIK